jgi:hypothetical protein
MYKYNLLSLKPTLHRLALIAVFSCSLSVSANLHAARVLNVCSIVTHACPYIDIQQAIDDAQDGDIIKIGPGIFSGPLTLGAVQHLYLVGEGSTQTVIQQIAYVTDPHIQEIVTCRGTTTVTISNLTITGNTYGFLGTGIRNEGCTIAVTNSKIQDITEAVNDGGGIFNNGKMWLVGSTVRNCRSSNGGGISNSGTLIIMKSTIENNTSVFTGGTRPGGGGILNEKLGKLTLVDTDVNNNISNSGGSGIANFGALFLNGSNVHHNISKGDMPPGVGGGIYNAGTLVLDKSLIDHNVVDHKVAIHGGGIFEAVGSVLKTSDRQSFFLDNLPDNCANNIGTVICPASISSPNSPSIQEQLPVWSNIQIDGLLPMSPEFIETLKQ